MTHAMRFLNRHPVFLKPEISPKPWLCEQRGRSRPALDVKYSDDGPAARAHGLPIFRECRRSQREPHRKEQCEHQEAEGKGKNVSTVKADLQVRGPLAAGAEAPRLQGLGQLVGVPQGVQEDRHEQGDVLPQACDRPAARQVQAAGALGLGHGHGGADDGGHHANGQGEGEGGRIWDAQADEPEDDLLGLRGAQEDEPGDDHAVDLDGGAHAVEEPLPGHTPEEGGGPSGEDRPAHDRDDGDAEQEEPDAPQIPEGPAEGAVDEQDEEEGEEGSGLEEEDRRHEGSQQEEHLRPRVQAMERTCLVEVQEEVHDWGLEAGKLEGLEARTRDATSSSRVNAGTPRRFATWTAGGGVSPNSRRAGSSEKISRVVPSRTMRPSRIRTMRRAYAAAT